VAPSADAGNYILYLHGRGDKCWVGSGQDCSQYRYLVNAPGWTNVTTYYDGSEALASSVGTAVENAVAAYCGGGNNCVVHCHSTGCLRMLKAVSDLRAKGNTLPGLLWAEASASAAGGSELAAISTQGLTGLMAKLFGIQHKVDYDLAPSAARDRWGYVQDDMVATVYHLAGKRDICVGLIGPLKLCGNAWINKGSADGAVAMHSTAGYSTVGTYWDGCQGGKYPYRVYDTDINPDCTGTDRDHMGVPEEGSEIVAQVLAGSYTDRGLQWSDAEPGSAACSNYLGECDNTSADSERSFCRKPDGSYVSECTHESGSWSNGDTFTAHGTCFAHCGGAAKTEDGSYCWCDPRCSVYGDCCADYASSNCAAVLSSIRQPIHRGYDGPNRAHYYSWSVDDLAKNASIEHLNYFYVYGDAVVSGISTALYRCTFPGNKVLLTSRSSCWDPKRSAYGTNDGILGYIGITKWDGAIDLYELYNPADGDRVYTISASEKDSLQGAGWSHSATWYVWNN
ncbi:MAG: hypothetical protein ACOC1F_11270, partial [Myxococcota bacterium]